MVGTIRKRSCRIRTTFSCSLFYWSRTLRFDRTNAAEASVINLYTHSEQGALVWTASNFTRTRLLIRISILRPPWLPGIPTGDDCTEQRGRSHEEVDQDPFSGLGRHHQFAECPLRGQRWSFGNCGGVRLFGRYR